MPAPLSIMKRRATLRGPSLGIGNPSSFRARCIEEQIAALPDCVRTSMAAWLQSVEQDAIRAPTIRRPAQTILDICQNSGRAFEEIERLAAKDPALAKGVLALASDAMFPRPRPDTLRAALVWVGLDGVRAVALDMICSDRIRQVGPYHQFLVRALRHARTMSHRAVALAGDVGVQPGAAALGALCHALGTLTLIDELIRLYPERPFPLALVHAVEQRHHARVGAWVCGRLGIAAELTDALLKHGDARAGDPRLARLLRFTDEWGVNQIGTDEGAVVEALRSSNIGLSLEWVRYRTATMSRAGHASAA